MTHYLHGQINSESAAALITAVDEGCRHISLNSQGGEVEDSLAIYDCLRRTPGITVEATGRCQSAAVLILLGGTHRLATPHTRFMIHKPYAGCYEGESFEDIAEANAEVERVAVTIQNILTERTHDPRPATFCVGPRSTYFDAATAYDLGILTSLQ